MKLDNRTIRVLVIIALIVIAGGVIAHVSQVHRTSQYLQDLALPGKDAQNPGKIMEAMAQLRQRGGAVAPQLIAMVQTGTGEAAPRAAWLLGMVGSTAGTPALLSAATAKDPVLRIAALQSLGKLRAAEALAPASKTLADPTEKPEVRSAAAYCLGMIGGDAVAAPLAAVLADHPKVLPPPPPPVPGALAAPPPPPDTTLNLRVAAANALGSAKAPSAVAALGASVRDDTEPSPEVRVAAAYALGDLGASVDASKAGPLAAALMQGLADKSGDVRVACTYSLGKVDLPRELEDTANLALKKAADDKHYWARIAAQQSRTQLKLSD